MNYSIWPFSHRQKKEKDHLQEVELDHLTFGRKTPTKARPGRDQRGENGWGPLGMGAPSCLTLPRSPLKGDVPNKYPLYKMYMGLIIKKAPIQKGPTPFSLWKKSTKTLPTHRVFLNLARFGLAETFALSSTRAAAAEEKHMADAALKWYRRLGYPLVN